MKHFIILLFATSIIISCRNKKIETKSVDTLAIDSLKMPSVALAFDPIGSISVKQNTALAEDINFFIISNETELDSLFDRSGANLQPDFIINYTIAIVPKHSSIEVERVELTDGHIDVFVKASESASASKPTAYFYAIERRSAVPYIDFYVNTKMTISLMLPIQ
jgi:hypothetical protein